MCAADPDVARRAARVAAASLVLVLVAAPGAASADALAGPPSTCPEGTFPRYRHAGGYCAPIPCQTDGDCAPRDECREVGLCMRTVHVQGWSSAGRIDEDIDVAIERCEDVSDCVSPVERAFVRSHASIHDEGQARCERVRACVRVTSPSAPAPAAAVPVRPARTSASSEHPPSRGCGGCAAPPTGRAGAGALACVAIALLALRRRGRKPDDA